MPNTYTAEDKRLIENIKSILNQNSNSDVRVVRDKDGHYKVYAVNMKRVS